MPESLTISRHSPKSAALDFVNLRREAIDYLQRVVGELWTDYNLHDPGVTLLEVLCYGITDAAYRTTFPDRDLFAPPAGEAAAGPDEPPFVTARHALTNAPLTPNHYRKLFLDRFDALRNVWFDEVAETLHAHPGRREIARTPPESESAEWIPFEVRGLYRIRLLLRDAALPPAEVQQLIEDVRRCYYRHRNICEDLSAVEITPIQDIVVCAEIRLEPDAGIEQTHAAVLHALQGFLSPGIRRYSLAELAARGMTPDEIFRGPVLENGFILDEDLDAARSGGYVRSSDLIRVIMAVEGVASIPKIQLNLPMTDGTASTPAEWELALPPGHEPRLTHDNARLFFYKQKLPFRTHRALVEEELATLQADEEAQRNRPLGPLDRPVPSGQPLALGSFTSLQESLPLTYQVGSRGYDTQADPSRRVQSKQLQAFLAIFDQLLANYLGQLVHLHELFSIDPDSKRTYFAQALEDLPGIEHLFAPFADWDEDTDGELDAATVANVYNDIITGKVARHDPAARRRGAMLDHLLARFGETFADYVLSLYPIEESDPAMALVEARRLFLERLSTLAYRRAQGHDVLDAGEVWDTGNVSGFQSRLGSLLGFPSSSRRSLSEMHFHLFEEEDEDDVSETRFRIRETEGGKIVLSATAHHENPEDAEDEMRRAVHLGMLAINYEIRHAKDGRFYFVIVDPSGEVVAMRKEFFDTREAAAAARDHLVDLLCMQYSDKGLFVVENLLLRPCRLTTSSASPGGGPGPESEGDGGGEGDGEPVPWPHLPAPCDAVRGRPQSWDPYSFRVHLVFPGFPSPLDAPVFRAHIEELAARELPAHLVPKICFVGREQLADFETKYRAWLTAVASGEPDPETLRALRDCLNDLHTIYRPGTLHDCSEDGDEQSALVLDETHLGELPDDTPEPEPPSD